MQQTDYKRQETSNYSAFNLIFNKVILDTHSVALNENDMCPL